MSKHNDLTRDENRPHNGMYLAGCPVCEKLDKVHKENSKKLRAKRLYLSKEEE